MSILKKDWEHKQALYKRAKRDEILILAQEYADACVHRFYAQEAMIGVDIEAAKVEEEIAYTALVEYLEEEL